MPTIQELNAKVDELQTALDEEQTAIQAAIDTLTTANTELQALVVAGGTEADRQAVHDKIDLAITDLKATIA